MKKAVIFLFMVVFLFAACKEDRKAIVYGDSEQESVFLMDSLATDTTKMLEAPLPFCFDSTRVLIQPLGVVSVDDKSDSRLSKSKYKGDGDDIYYSNGSSVSDRITGRMINVCFDDINNNKKHLLTDKVLNITQIIYLRPLAREIEKDYLIYMVYDKDSNRDGKLNGEDILALYISKLDGIGFEKITSDNQCFVEGELFAWAKRYYFNTREDTNKNNIFDTNDRKHYYYIDFSDDTYQVVKYNPLVGGV